MMNAARCLLPALVLAATATPVLAQPGGDFADYEQPPVAGEPAPQGPADGAVVVITPAPTAPTGAPPVPEVVAVVAPQNERWSNVNHINGQLVKVGEKGEYLLKHKTTSISTNPIGWMFGFYGVSVTHAVHPNVAIRGDVNIFRDVFDDSGSSGYEVGASIPIYFRRVFSGPFLEPGIIARDFDTAYDSSSDLLGPEMLFGWHWTFDSGFNVAMALGAARSLSSPDQECYADYNGGTSCYESAGAEVQPAGYFRVGYAW